MSGICGIAIHDSGRQLCYDDLTPMVDELALSSKGKSCKEIVDSIGFGAQEFPGRLVGVAQYHEQGRTSLLGFQGNIYNLDEVLAPITDYQSPLQALLQLSLRGIGSFLTRLRGEFVLALWDAAKETLFLATDRFRMHPLFYRQDQDRLCSLQGCRVFWPVPLWMT